MYNKISIIGRLGANPDLRYTASGTAVCNLRVATSRYYKKNDEKVEVVTWFRVVVWSQQAENCGRYLMKGQQVFVEGSMENRKWKDNDGNERDGWEIHANNVIFLARPSGGNGGSQTPDQGSGPGPDDQDIPF